MEKTKNIFILSQNNEVIEDFNHSVNYNISIFEFLNEILNKYSLLHKIDDSYLSNSKDSDKVDVEYNLSLSIILDMNLPIYIKIYDKIKDNIIWDSLSKYSFFESGMWVKIILEISDIGKHNSDKILCDFTERSFNLKVYDFNNKNLKFACPMTHNKFNNEESKIWIKENKITICLRKIKKEDNWFTIYKQKMIGEEPED